jgi:type II secretory pathway predicted ATPase ExeA
MYLNHFHIEAMPFEIGPDPKFLWLGSKHQEAFAILHYGIVERKGFVVITGEPGTGKSTLLNATMASFDNDVRFAKISEPALSTMDFVNFAADAFDMGQSFTSKGEFLIQLKRFVREAGTKRLTLVIDEAQRVLPEMLEQIRVFSDIEGPGQRAFSCIFAGQPEFLETIKRNPALCQRVFFSHTLQLLTMPETGDYIAHRLKVAGCNEPLFTPAAIDEIHRLSKGNPRLINILCDQALLTGYASLKTRIDPEMIREGIESTLIPLQTAANPPPEPAKPAFSAVTEAPAVKPIHGSASHDVGRKRRAYIPAVVAMGVLMLSVFIFSGDGFDRISRFSVAKQTAGDQGDAGGESLRARLAELQTQKEAAETRLRGVQESAATLESRLRELQTVGEQATKREEIMSQKEATIAELRQRLELAGANQSSVSSLLESMKKENNQLQAQLAEANNQKRLIDARLTEEQKLSAGLSADARALKNARDRVSQLEAAVSDSDKKMGQLQQAAADLDKALLKEKAAKEQVNADVAARQTAIADLQKKLEAARSLQQKLEGDIQNVRSDNTRLQAQLQESKGRPQPPAAAGVVPPQGNSPPAPTLEGRAEGPDPERVIDYVIKRKSQQ